jgi:hypothetical protein
MQELRETKEMIRNKENDFMVFDLWSKNTLSVEFRQTSIKAKKALSLSLHEIFSDHGNTKNVRIPTSRSEMVCTLDGKGIFLFEA